MPTNVSTKLQLVLCGDFYSLNHVDVISDLILPCNGNLLHIAKISRIQQFYLVNCNSKMQYCFMVIHLIFNKLVNGHFSSGFEHLHANSTCPTYEVLFMAGLVRISFKLTNSAIANTISVALSDLLVFSSH